MKKMTKDILTRMAVLLPELDAEDQRCILGGTATTTIPPDYTGTVPVPTPVATTVDPYAVTGSMPTTTTTSTVPTTTTAIPTTTATTTTTTTVAPTGAYVNTGSLTTTSSDGVMESALLLSTVLLADDVSGIGTIDDVLIPLIIGGAAIYDFVNAGNGNDSYPGPWTYTQPSEPLHEIEPFDNGNYAPGGGGLGLGVLGGIDVLKGIYDGTKPPLLPDPKDQNDKNKDNDNKNVQINPPYLVN